MPPSSSSRSSSKSNNKAKKMGKFDGKTVIVTGSSSGMGQTIAVRFATEGANVMLHGRDEKGIKATLDLIAKHKKGSTDRVSYVLGPLEKEKTLEDIVSKTIEKFKRIDILVNAAGIGAKPGADFQSMENFDFIMAVNCRAPVQLALFCVPHLEKTKGCIINISSIASVITSVMMPFYSMAKAALDMFTKNYAVILGPKGIRVNSLNPGLVRTGFQSRMAPNAPAKDMQTYIDNFEKNGIPIGRSGNTEEMADSVVYLATANFMTGALLIHDGGATLKH
ncbi:Short-chain dehydrogenase reductase SDR domain containing protein [Aphelenchoides bicaudatus]|nr:Short-chain dehydrogenase reductase SDR domain containing protein [Aphelenchoides bicaudatus]